MSIKRNILDLGEDPPVDLRFYTARIETALMKRVERKRLKLQLPVKVMIERMCNLFVNSES